MKIGFLGAGLIGGEHLTGITDLIDRNVVDASLSGIFDPDETRAADFHARFGFERRYESAVDLIQSPDVEVVFVATWTGAHAELVDLCCEARKPVFCEKPLARDLAEARRMQENVDRTQTPNQIGLILRTSPSYGFAKGLCENPSLGRLMGVGFRDDQYFPIQGRYGSQWRKEVEKAGGGTFIEHSIHDVDLMHWMFGPFDRVVASTGNFAGHHGIEDLAMVTGRLAQGGQVQFLSVWHNITTRPSTRFLEIFFEHGRIAVEGEVFGPVTLERSDAPCQTFEQAEIAQAYLQNNPDLMALGLQVASPQEVEDFRFLKALAEGERPGPEFSEAVLAHEVVEAAYRSAGSGSPVHLSEFRAAESDSQPLGD